MDITALVRQRGVVKGQLTKAQNHVNSVDNATVCLNSLRNRRMLAQQNFKRFEELQQQIEETIDTNTELQTHLVEREDIELKYLNLLTSIDKILELRAPTSTIGISCTSSTSSAHAPNVKLPRLDVPTFDGKYENWASFHDLFLALVHNNHSITGAQKLQYLKGALHGEASNVIRSMPITDDNYAEAWQILKERFDNKRQIINTHLKAIFKISPIPVDSSSHLRSMLDTVQESLRALKALKRSTDKWDDILVHHLADKFDPVTREKWEAYPTAGDFPTFSEISTFLDGRCRVLEALASGNNTHKKPSQQHSRKVSSHVVTNTKCVICKDDHPIFKCKSFIHLEVEQRIAETKKNGLCYNCLRPGHSSNQCKSGHCQRCSQKHNTLLHKGNATATAVEQRKEANPSQGRQQQGEQTVTTFSSHISQVGEYVLLATAIIQISDGYGNKQQCRALLDSGSQASFITESCLQRLHLKKKPRSIQINGVGASAVGTCTGSVKLTLSSKLSTYMTSLEVYVLPRITSVMPAYKLKPGNWPHLKYLTLADPNYHIPSEIDILLGADIFVELMLSDRVVGSEGTPYAQNTVFGWILSGKICETNKHNIIISSHVCSTEEDKQLTRFWEIEEVNNPNPVWTPEEEACENAFVSTVKRDLQTGRFIVRLPFKDNKVDLGASRDRAVRRLKQMEKRLQVNDNMYTEYRSFMKEYLELGHMRRVPLHDYNNSSANYLPHHMVTKLSSTTTKYRVVFDASAKTGNGKSLNDNLLIGPKLQRNLFAIVHNFRLFSYVFTADICKMYRQIQVSEEDVNLLRILWREAPTDPIEEFCLLTDTYGTACAGFLAVRCLLELAQQYEQLNPVVSKLIQQCFYMDDLLGGVNELNEGLEIQKQLIEVLASAGFQLRKWSSNCPALLESLPEEFRETKVPLDFDSDESIKTLGVVWHPAKDIFTYKVNLSADTKTPATKRSLLSDTAKLFDPMGWLSPAILQAKCMFQSLWTRGLSWDEPLPDDLASDWTKLKGELHLLEDIQIKRHVGVINNNTEFHGFSDASEKAYGAVIYSRTVNSDGVHISLLTSKTRVAPVRSQSIPRLELCAALLLVDLMKTVLEVHEKIENNNIYLWSDSTVVLCWLNSHASRWQTFVSNRVSKIQTAYPSSAWKHVAGFENPADYASRGLLPSELINNELWWNGPLWLATEKEYPNQSYDVDAATVMKEEKSTITSHLTIHWYSEYISRYSSLTRLHRVTAWVLRYRNNRDKRNVKISGELSVNELHNAMNVLIRVVQSETFGQEIKCCLNNKNLPDRSALLALKPFVDADGLLRVGGRLVKAKISSDQKYPIVLPKSHHFTRLLIQQIHWKTLHGGNQLMLATLQQKYWVIGAKGKIQQQIHRCITCFRAKPKVAQQIMGDLPRCRVQQARPFSSVGVDYAGPVIYKLNNGRGSKTAKGYISLFVCMVTRAIHLEFVSDLTSSAFLAALRRMTSRRGLCTTIYSDCGTNFVGAKREMEEMCIQLSSQQHNDYMKQILAQDSINWVFNPPAAPHFGGMWESGVKSTKHHLKRVSSSALYTFEEMTTLLCQIEAQLNSRPISALCTDPTDLSALTPGHFLVGQPLNAIPEPNVTHIKMNRLSRWQLIQQQTQHFWTRWHSDYLNQLQQRPKWVRDQENIKEGDLVLILDNNLPSCKWNMGRVIETHPGDDNKVRVVKLKTKSGEMTRLVAKICPLPIDEE